MEITTPISEKEKNNTLTPEQAKQVITLKIRTESGKRTLTLKVLFTEKISLIYKLIKDHRFSFVHEIFLSSNLVKQRISKFGEVIHLKLIQIMINLPWKTWKFSLILLLILELYNIILFTLMMMLID